MEKSAEAFRTISEVADLLKTPAHVLRFWESRFPQIKPLKRAGGRRYYRPSDLALLGGIKKLLHEDGMTIRGVQKILREKGVRHVAALAETAGTAADDVTTAKVDPRAAADLDADHAPWPAAIPPVAAAPGTGLQPDPDDTPESVEEVPMEVEEAPMEIDAPTLPLGLPDNIRTIQPAVAAGTAAAATLATPAADETAVGGMVPSPVPAPSERDQDAIRPPAATMLRAMDALRARDNKSELRVVYNRLMNLRDRLAERNRQTPV